MKKVRRIIALALVLTMTLGVAAWAGPVLDRILERGELVVGTSGDQAPLSAKTEEGEIIGLDADLSKLMASAMGVRLKMTAMPFADLLPALEAGKIDMILSGMTITTKRNLRVAFVGPYYVSGKGILTKTQSLASMQNAADLNTPEVTLAALEGSTSQEFVETLLPKAELITTKTLDEALGLLFVDRIDALIADTPYCAVAAFRYQAKGLVAGAAPFTFEPLGIALPGNDPLLVNWVENFLARLQGMGKLKELRERWFNDPSWLQRLPFKAVG